MRSLYNEDYYERGIETGVSLYTNYRWIPELTIPLCAVLIETLGISEGAKILDFGCAKGFYVKAFRLLHRDAYGVDISEYAVGEAPRDIKPFVKCINGAQDIEGFFDWIIAKDVMEHIRYEDIGATLAILKSLCRKMFCIIPLGDGKKYVVPIHDMEKSHIIREDMDWWNGLFRSCGFEVLISSYKMKHVKENYKKWEKGHGFFLLENLDGTDG